jgi:hypothetical protein
MAYAFWERSVLESFMKSGWSQTPVKWENTPFTVPKDNGSYAPYVAFSLKSGTGHVASLGSSLLQRAVSLAVIQVFVPESTGSGVRLRYVDELLDLWRAQDLTDGVNVIRTRPSYHLSVGVDRGWFESQVIVPYMLDNPVPNH